jgi:hypothetical protein
MQHMEQWVWPEMNLILTLQVLSSFGFFSSQILPQLGRIFLMAGKNIFLSEYAYIFILHIIL